MRKFFNNLYNNMLNFLKADEVKKDTVKVDRKAYKALNKNQLVQMLIKRGIIDFNKRQPKSELIDLLVEDDKKKL